MNGFVIYDFVDPARAASVREQLQRADKTILLIGTGTSLIEPNPDILIYADLPRWEIQQRQRSKKIFNLGLESRHDSAGVALQEGGVFSRLACGRPNQERLVEQD
jgi:hypothetical protein